MMNAQTELAIEAGSETPKESVTSTSPTPVPTPSVDKKLVAQLVGQARESGIAIDGENGPGRRW